MGYTHYLTQVSETDPRQHAQFTRVLDIMQAIAEDQQHEIETSRFYEEQPNGKHYTRGPAHIVFTGYEGMVFPQRGFASCKTAHEPFDTAVVACYHVAATLMPDVYKFTSDGGYEEDVQVGKDLGDFLINKSK